MMIKVSTVLSLNNLAMDSYTAYDYLFEDCSADSRALDIHSHESRRRYGTHLQSVCSSLVVRV